MTNEPVKPPAGASQPGANSDKQAQDSIAFSYHVVNHALGLAVQNAVAYQQMMNTLSLALVARLGAPGTERSAGDIHLALEAISANSPARQLAELAELIVRFQGIVQRSAEPSAVMPKAQTED